MARAVEKGRRIDQAGKTGKIGKTGEIKSGEKCG
jgi:hypothetical protein